MTSRVQEGLLIARILGGERELFADLVRPHEPALRRLAGLLLRDAASAEDAMQEALLRAYLHLARFRREASFRTWMTSILINEVRMHWRRSGGVRWVSLDVLRDRHRGEYPAVVPGRQRPADEMVMHQQTRKMLEAAVNRLPETARRVIQLRDYADLGVGETAQVLGITPTAVKLRHSRARKGLANLIRDGAPGAAMACGRPAFAGNGK